jgi:predicted component of type VI protein secretion system
MAFKIRIVKNSGELFLDKLFESEKVTIGRQDDNDIELKDNFISRYHAEIRESDGTYLLVSKASTWTYLEDEQLTKNVPIKIADSSHIRVPGFSIFFEKIAEVANDNARNLTEGMAPDIEYSADATINSALLAFMLRERYNDIVNKPKEERIRILEAALMQNGGAFTLDNEKRETFFFTLTRFRSNNISKAADEWSKTKLNQKAYDDLTSLSQTFAKTYTLDCEKKTGEFSNRLKEIVIILIDNFFNSLCTYRELQQEFDVGATRYFNLESNPVKIANSKESLYEYLLNPEKADITKVKENLNDVHRDITVHQMAVLKGLKKSLKELLHEMSPGVLAKEANVEVEKSDYKKIWDKFIGKDQTSIWNRYIEKYTELSENETRTFNLVVKKFQQDYYSQIGKVRKK